MGVRLKALTHTFQNPGLLEAALTHPSILSPGKGMAFERLEFLGDRVLGLIVSAWLFEKFPSDSEGDLSKRLMGLVCKDILVKVARSIELDQALRIKKEVSSSQEKRMETLLADGCEALIGALYLDGGLQVAEDFVHTHWRSYLTLSLTPPRDSKSSLQEWAQGAGRSSPSYKVIKTDGPPHAPTFTVEVSIEGHPPTQGVGSSKQLAEKEAARRMLDQLRD